MIISVLFRAMRPMAVARYAIRAMSHRRSIVVALLLMLVVPARMHADEGIWVPMLLRQTAFQRMQELGMMLEPDDIYSDSLPSLKDAVVLFGGGCTGVVVSDRGLLLTNHHCGYGQIQRHSSVQHDYLADGFWARNLADELPNPGLTVAFLLRMEDVTGRVLQGVLPAMNERQRADSVAAAIVRIHKQFGGDNHIEIKPVYEGNRYWMYVYEVFRDIRLVGAPPSSIGKFGGDTDNWMWPRHTGDFSMFRIYADKNNRPADYSPDNVPYHPRRYAQVSTAGVNEGDFTMVYGYPAVTDSYISSFELEDLIRRDYPARVATRSSRLNIMDAHMQVSRSTGIQYAAKYAGVSNAWKKWQGAVRGVQRVDGIATKRAEEQQLADALPDIPAFGTGVSRLHHEFAANTKALVPVREAMTYLPETVLAIEAVAIAGQYDAFIASNAADNENVEAWNERVAAEFYRNYSPQLDKDIFIAMMEAYYANVRPEYVFDEMKEQLRKHGSVADWAEHAYATSVFRSKETLDEVLMHPTKRNMKRLQNDPFLAIWHSARKMVVEKVNQPWQRLTHEADSLQRNYMALQMSAGDSATMYPDANHTLRISFGTMQGYEPADGMSYRPFTTLEGIFEKEATNQPDYTVPQALKDAAIQKDYGRYADNEGKTVPVCFLSSCHTSGGNSGSPVFNWRGELVGLNFDRNWEGTMSDVLYDPDRCRNITADIRYILFVIDRVYGATTLIDEMKLKCECEE